ncbi:MAG: VCBS repeat-containing protein, partial [Christiangramia sp.]
MNRISSVYFSIIILLLYSCADENSAAVDEEEKESFLFERIDPEISGLDFENSLTETDSMNILDYLYFYNGGGVAIGDINNDGLQDIFFTSNQKSNRLYLNKGNLTFEDITEQAGIAGNSDWNTGTVMADVNADGFLDIYVLAVSGIQGLEGKNELFINNGNRTFTEKASEYGIDLENYGTSASFFDFDNDGDLDLYVLNHAVHTEDSFGPTSIRERRAEASGDKLFEFREGKFYDVSEKAGIYGGPNAYGLGIATADFNNDGYTDIYISNDFH